MLRIEADYFSNSRKFARTRSMTLEQSIYGFGRRRTSADSSGLSKPTAAPELARREGLLAAA
jgi:hypothetical protein